MSKPLTLTDWQAKYLQQHGKLTLLVPMEKQPTDSKRAKLMQLLKPRSPHHKGDVIECREVYDCDCGICNFCNGGKPPTKKFRLTLTADPEPVDVREISEELAVECGVGPEADRSIYNPYPPELDLESAPAMIRYYNQTHGPDKPWSWIYRLEGE